MKARLIALLAFAVTTSCGGDSTEPAPVLTTVEITGAASPNATTLQAGQTLQLSAVAKDQVGKPLVGVPITWTGLYPLVATVSPTGLVTAKLGGSASATATATKDGATAASTLVITVPFTPAGTWSGNVGTQTLTLTLVHNSGVVSGTGTLTNTPTGTRALVANGTFSSPNVTITLSSGSTTPFQLAGTVVTGAINGTLTGSGFTGNSILLLPPQN